MSRYRKIDPRIWNDEKFMRFTDDGQLAFLFILTHQHLTALGAMRATIAGLAAEKRWQEGRFRDAIGDAIRDEVLIVNEMASFMAVKNYLKYNEPEGPNSVSKAWVDAIDLIPECPEKRLLIYRARQYLSGRTEEFRAAVQKTNPRIWDAFPDIKADAIRDAMPDPVTGTGATATEEENPPKAPQRGAAVTESDFNECWATYPNPIGRKAALRHFLASVKTPVDLANVRLALSHYVTKRNDENAQRRAQGRAPIAWQNGSTWFNDWQSWIPKSSNGGAAGHLSIHGGEPIYHPQVKPHQPAGNPHGWQPAQHRCELCAVPHVWDCDHCGCELELEAACPEYRRMVREFRDGGGVVRPNGKANGGGEEHVL